MQPKEIGLLQKSHPFYTFYKGISYIYNATRHNQNPTGLTEFNKGKAPIGCSSCSAAVQVSLRPITFLLKLPMFPSSQSPSPFQLSLRDSPLAKQTPDPAGRSYAFPTGPSSENKPWALSQLGHFHSVGPNVLLRASLFWLHRGARWSQNHWMCRVRRDPPESSRIISLAVDTRLITLLTQHFGGDRWISVHEY